MCCRPRAPASTRMPWHHGHPRPDARHITYKDVRELDAMLRAEYKTEFNIEGYPTDDFLDLVCEVKPAQATLVPIFPTR